MSISKDLTWLLPVVERHGSHRWMSKSIFMLSMFWSLISLAQAPENKNQKFLDRVDQGHSSQESPAAAKKEITNNLINKAIETLTKEIIGDAKWGRHRQLINSKVMKNAARFIPLMHPGELLPTPPQGFKMSLQMRISIEDLNRVLQENGLLNATDAALSALPLIQVTDRVQLQTYRWWRDNEESAKNFLQRQGRSLEGALKMGLQKNYFYLLPSTQFKVGELLPGALKKESLKDEDKQLLAEIFNCQILIDGELAFERGSQEGYVIQLRLQAFQASNGRVVGEVVRTLPTEDGHFESAIDRKLKDSLDTVISDFSNQILEAWQRGSLGSTVYQLVLKGTPTIKTRELIKESLKQKSAEVRMIRERLIAAGEVTFEVDSPLSPQELANNLSSTPVGGARLQYETTDGNSISFKLVSQ